MPTLFHHILTSPEPLRQPVLLVRLDLLPRLSFLFIPRFHAHGATAHWEVHRVVLVGALSPIPWSELTHSHSLIWGIILACHAATHSFAGIMATRFLLGAAEAAVSPGFSLITGMWYLREEQPLRHGLWFAGNSVATAFGGLIAYGVAHIRNSVAAWKVSQ